MPPSNALPLVTLFATLLCALLVSGQAPLECDVTDATVCPVAHVCAPIDADVGICARPPVSGAVLTTDATKFPIPVAFFPLTGHSLDTWPVNSSSGVVRGAVWAQDHEFGSALHCAEDLRDVVQLDNVAFGRDGAFTLNLWMKKSLARIAGGHHQFIFSAAAEPDPLQPTQPNQVHVYWIEQGNPDFGLLRAVVRDADDEGDTFHIDSDGSVNVTGSLTDPVERQGIELRDGEWHMITLTTIPANRRRQRNGFRLYIDGALVSEARGNGATGGDPLNIDRELFLCGRADDEPQRHFDGSIAKLSIFDEALEPAQVEAMFVAVRQSTLAQQITTSEQLQIWNEESNLTFYEDPEIGLRYVRGPDQDTALLGRTDEVDVSSPPNTFSLSEFLSAAELCPATPVEAGLDLQDFCQEGEVCVSPHRYLLPLLHEASGLSPNESASLNGVCSTLPEGGSLWKGTDFGLPAPMAYFPMTGGDLTAWPVPEAQGRAVAADLVEDEVFGRVYECAQERGSFLILDNVPYGRAGHFAINFWFQSADLSGNSTQFLFSHGSFQPYLETRTNNQIQIFITEADTLTPGLVRAFVRDSTDMMQGPEGRMFLDSDGNVAIEVNADREVPPEVDVSDGEWHMLTLSTLTSISNKGFSMYLDGTLVGEMTDDVVYLGEDGIQRPVTGGDSLRPGGKIYLCGRHDGGIRHHFSGRIAEVMLFNEPLRDAQIRTLYEAAEFPASGRRGRKLMQTDIGTAESDVLSPAAANDTSIEGLPLGSWWGQYIGDPGQEFGSCSGEVVEAGADRADMVFCGSDLRCLPVLTGSNASDLARNRICVQFPSGGAYIFDDQDEIALPIGYFPLTDGRLDSFPFPSYQGLSSEELIYVQDEVFGSVMDCSALSEDHVILPNVLYPSGLGEFTVAFWMRQREHHLEKETGFETLFSHIGNPDTYSGFTDPNQIQIALETPGSDAVPVLRVVVRDADDTASEIRFVDADGEVDVTDGLWHMIAVTSHPEASSGFRVYLDGAIAGELRGSDATGGDPLQLASDIHLCGSAGSDNSTHFGGNLAHLMLWDLELTPEEILALYERLVLASEDVQIEHPVRRTVDGETCLFPGILNGEAVVDCAPLDGVLKCPVRNGSWVECQEFDDSQVEPQIEAIPAVVYTTVTGDPCVQPGRIGDRDVYGCVDFDGVFRCETRTGQWHRCSPQIKLRYTVSGAPCVFPFTYQQAQYRDCVQTELSGEFCEVANGTLEECAPAIIRDAPEQVTPPERDVAVVDSVLSRITVDNEICQFPWWFRGRSVGSCVDVNPNPVCRTVAGNVASCAPIIYTTERIPCAFPFQNEDQLEFGCIQREGASMCRVTNGSWGICVQERVPIPVNEPLPLLPGRVTVTNASCTFPFWYQGVSVSDCVGSPVQECQTGAGRFEECQPKRLTVNGDTCSFPFDFEEETHYTCIEVEGMEQCRTANGTLEACTPLGAATGTVPRISVSGESCAFPFDYDGASQTDCVEINGEESCKVEDGSWATCAPLVELSIISRTTITGEPCQIPFIFEDQLMTDCFMGDDGIEYCQSNAAEPLVECAERPNEASPERIEVQYPAVRNTTEGVMCAFPFQYQDAWWVNCLVVDGLEYCLIGDGSWHQCVPLRGEQPTAEEIPARLTVNGDPCVFPLFYNDEEHYDCVELDDTESCKIEDGSWQECAPIEAPESTRRSRETPTVQRFTVDGDECIFPLNYRGDQFLDCVERDSTESCRDADGMWKECEPLENRASSATPRYALNGDPCVFPLFYNDEEHYDCVELDESESCKTEDGSWQECVPLRSVTVLSQEAPSNAESEDDSSSSDSISAGAVVGIVMAVLVGVLFVVALVVGGWYMRQKRTEKHFEHSTKNFERFDDEGIPMAAMGSSKVQKPKNEATDDIPL